MRLVMLPGVLLLVACSGDHAVDRAVGQLESDRVEVAFETHARIVDRGPAEGTAVTPETVLFALDTALAMADLRAAQARMEERAASLAELTNGTRPEVLAQAGADLAGARDTVDFRERELQRLAELVERALVAPSQVDAARTALEEARSVLAARRARLTELANGARPEAIQRAQAALAAAEAERDRLAELLNRHQLRAGVTGRLDRYLFETGEWARAGAVGAVVLIGEQPLASVFLPAAMRAALEVGDPVEVSVEGLEAPLAGRIDWISAEAAFTPYFALTERDRGRLSFRAEVVLDIESRDRLPDGLPVEVRPAAGARP